MPARRRSGFRGVSRPRPATDWARIVPSGMTTVGVSTKVVVATFTLSNVGISETVRRVRGRVLATSDQVAVGEAQLGAFGLIVVNDVALALGATGIPGPVTEASDDGWFVWEPLIVISQASDGQSSGGVGAYTSRMCNFEFDSKAMRKVEEGFGIAVMVENEHASAAMEFAVGISLLGSRR